MTIDKTMTTYNHCGAHHWFDVDGMTYILLENNGVTNLLDRDYNNITTQEVKIHNLLINLI
ncbi:hypothetical protein [Vibrio breoganii]|uniref:hypothetical protein n=1 Tax=Vibrio breoganii TaxID=553239 RepID=UPI000C846A0F|nr:hypothetical protein [Vibrio breoganii]PMG05170.1 hypothetical protein BCV00_13380 [Vibrio breoganii]PMK30724.1 hypothetical protein BCU03_08840 [Vibrio breoganii]